MKKKITKQNDLLLFFIFLTLILLFIVVTVQEIQITQLEGQLSFIEDVLTRIENNTGELVDVVERYERALEVPETQTRESK